MILAAFLLGCSTSSQPSEVEAHAQQTTIRLALNWYPEPEFGGFYEAALGGLYEEAGFDVEIIPGGPGAPSLELLAAGRAEAAITAADDLLLKRGAGIAAQGVFAAFQTAPMGVMVHAGTNITSLNDMPDGQIAIEIGSPFQTFLWDKYAWESRVQPIPYGGGVGAFLQDAQYRQQAYITAEPCLATAQGAEVTFLKASDAGWNPYSVVLAVPDPPPPWVDAFVDATRQGWKNYMENPARANDTIAELNDQLEPELLNCITEAQRSFVETASAALGEMNAERWNETAAHLVRLQMLPEGSTAEGAWRNP